MDYRTFFFCLLMINAIFSCGKSLLSRMSEESGFDVRNMMQVLRDEPSGINRDTHALLI